MSSTSSFRRPDRTGSRSSGAPSQQLQARVGHTQEDEQDINVDAHYPVLMPPEPMPFPPDYLLWLGKRIFWVGGVAIGNGGQCITTIVTLLVLMYKNPIYFLAPLINQATTHGWGAIAPVLWFVDFFVRLLITAALAVVFQIIMILVVINTTGTWGTMLFSHSQARDQLQGKRPFSLLVTILLVFEALGIVGDIFSDGAFIALFTQAEIVKWIFVAALSFATLVLSHVGWLLKDYAEYKIAELRMIAEAHMGTQQGATGATGS
jgi:hypothetical protein